jgi:N-acetylglucosamine kinase-like BadF-type ATPase
MPTTLLSEALSFFKVDEPADLIRVFYNDFDKAAIARFARVVCKARDRGDPLARDIFDTAARELVGLVVSVNASIGSRLEKRRLAIKGGLVEGDAELRNDLEQRLRALIPGIEIVSSLADAATGACALARALNKGELIGTSSPARE